MDKAFINTLVYLGLTIVVGGVGFFLKRMIKSIDDAIARLNMSVDALVKMVSTHEADHKVFVVKLEHLGEKFNDHESRIDDLEQKVG